MKRGLSARSLGSAPGATHGQESRASAPGQASSGNASDRQGSMPSQEASTPDRVSEETIRSVVLSADLAIVAQFRVLRQRNRPAIRVLAETYQGFQTAQGNLAAEERAATVQMFVHASINSVITSLHHLVHGYPIASAHMMRHFVESIAMAMLCADDRTGVYGRYRANRTQFDVNSALHLITKKNNKKLLADSLGFDADAWATILEMVKLYDKLSHASSLALGFQMLFTA